MIAGVGIDLCGIVRMEKMMEKGRFLERYFSEEERAYLRNKGINAAQSAAGLYAAKEALTKALGTGIVSGALSDICVLHDENGAPYYDLRGTYAALAEQKGIIALHLSVSHEGDTAAAVCVAERNG
ncbi:MAG: holo-ACP synthase [Clostridiales bacterium]|nr:holo-ACP synthase [Clostridiales bacterium]